jgi:hypothetical protein
MLTRKLIRADGTSEEIPPGKSMADLRALIGAQGIDTVNLRHMGEPLHVMLVDDKGYETEMVEKGSGHFELRPTKARKPVNAEATKLYLANCRPGTTHQIVGDVIVVPDLDFA